MGAILRGCWRFNEHYVKQQHGTGNGPKADWLTIQISPLPDHLISTCHVPDDLTGVRVFEDQRPTEKFLLKVRPAGPVNDRDPEQPPTAQPIRAARRAGRATGGRP